MKCPNCNEEIEDDSKFCSQCGTKIEQSCPKCNNVISQDAKFCSNCGYKLVDSGNGNYELENARKALNNGDYQKAFYWFKKSAEQGDSLAINKLKNFKNRE